VDAPAGERRRQAVLHRQPRSTCFEHQPAPLRTHHLGQPRPTRRIQHAFTPIGEQIAELLLLRVGHLPPLEGEDLLILGYTMSMDENTEDTTLRFLVDENAARLVRWLRLIGCDTLFVPAVDDAALVERARSEQRVLLTRDRGLLARRPIATGVVRGVLLASDDTWQQLEQVVRLFHLDPRAAPFTRCASCNARLEAASPQEARPHVPPFIAATHRAFMRCPHCNHYYWPGTHWQKVTARLAALGSA
jgi:uncharacterized protein with PIN domain